jgi:hypothetical protein
MTAFNPQAAFRRMALFLSQSPIDSNNLSRPSRTAVVHAGRGTIPGGLLLKHRSSVMKKLILILVVLIILGGVGGYVWLGYSQAQTALTQARQEVRSVDEVLHRQQNVGRAAELHQLAKVKVEALTKFHSTWLPKAEIDALEKELATFKEEIDKAKIRSER